MVSRQFFVFVSVGTACAILDIGVMQLLILAGIHHVLAATVGFLAGLAANFLMHANITFQAKYSHAVLARFLVVVLINYLITIALVSVSHDLIGNALLGKVVSLPVIALNGFLLSKYWIFK